VSLRAAHKKKVSLADIPFAAVLSGLFIFNFSGLIRQEVARVWLIFTPLLVASMGGFITEWVQKSKNVFPFIAVSMFLQSLFFEIFLDMLW
jgi:uncharacterized membrane protein YoaK (UPF0700 family)